MTGTVLKCDCCGRETLAVGKPQEGMVEVRDRRHGTNHTLALTLPAIVKLLDPQGTTVAFVGSIA